jgi:hypothetical protein
MMTSLKRVFISQPMKDKTDAQILDERNRAIETIKKRFGTTDIEIIDSFIEDTPYGAKPLWYLGKSIEFLSTADVAYFIGDWRNYRGCKIENTCAKEYGIDVIEE